MEIYIEDPDLGTLVHMYQGLGDQNEWRQEAATANRRHVLIFLVVVVFIVNNDY